MIRPATSKQSPGPETGGTLGSKLANRTARVGVVGIGYVGLPTMVAAAEAGFNVTGIDIDQCRVDQINAGKSYIDDVPGAILKRLVMAGMISATDSYNVLGDMDVLLVCVPTPLTKNKEPDLGALEQAVNGLAAHLREHQLVVLQSTTYPGTTQEFALPRLEKNGWRVGSDFYLAYALERVDPGNLQYGVRNVPKVVGGVTPECTRLATEFFAAVVDEVVPVGSPRVAEMTKLLENTFRSVNIALVTEMAMLCRRMGIDIWEVIEAASTKPFGFMPFYPGPGVGGHCIPVDPFYLSWKAKEYDFYINFIQLAAEINDNAPYYTLSRISEILGERGIPLSSARVLILGVTFKENIKDTRNSPALRIIEFLQSRIVEVAYSDRNVSSLEIDGRSLQSIDISSERLQQFDAVVILVGHQYYDLAEIVDNAKLVIDTRNVTSVLGPRDNVVKL